VWLGTATVLAAISSHFSATVTYPYPITDSYNSVNNSTVERQEPLPICYVLPAYDWFFVHIWYWIDFTLLAFVPFVVVLTGNCVMVTCVVRAVRFRNRQEPLSVGSAGPRGSGSGGATVGGKDKALTSSTVMLMTLSLVFLLTTSPNVIYFLKIDDWAAGSKDAHSEAKLRLGFAITNLLFFHLSPCTAFPANLWPVSEEVSLSLSVQEQC